MSPVLISLLMLAGFGGFGLLCWRHGQILRALAPAARWDHPAARLRSVWRNGLLQQRMVRREPPAGLMHAVIFLGFLSLLLRKLQLIAAGYIETASLPAFFGGPFAAFKDFVELAVLAAVAVAFWRRLVLRPARLAPRGEALLVLSLIAAIMLTDFAFDAFRFARLAGSVPALAHEQAFAFIGGPLGHWAAGLAPALQEAGYRWAYGLQMATVFGFLVLLPTGEHFHIVTALPALFFRRGRPANQVPAVDIERLLAATEEAQMQAGISSARELSWKEGLDVLSCTQCGRCTDACPTALTGKPLSMKAVNHALRQHLQAERVNLHAGRPTPPLVGPVISDDTLWACTSCGYCEEACPIELEHLPRFFGLRQHRVMIDGEFPHELKRVFEAWESQGNPWGLPAEQRGDWAQGLGIPVVKQAADLQGLEFLFYVGSAMSYDPRGQKIARAFVRVLQHAGVSFGILGAAEGSTGECARRLGNELLFQQLAGQLVQTLNAVGARRVVTCDPHALNTLRHEFPAFGGHWEVLHHSQLMAQLLQQGRLKPLRRQQRLVFHDPCYLGRHNGEYEAPRQVLAALCLDAPLEFGLAREKSMCCGAGGGRMWLEEKLGTRINVARAGQALALQPAALATACPYCAVMLTDGLADARPGAPVPVLDLAELMAQALPQPAA